jgi:hypothetical protein
LAADLPHNIEVNISKLQTFADTIHIKDLNISAKVEVLTPAEEVVAKVQPPRDMEKELSETAPVEDVSKVEGAAETPSAPGEAPAKAEAKKE